MRQTSRLSELGQVTRLAERARHQRLQSYLTGVAVDLDSQPEGVEDGATLLGVGFGERLAEVGEGGEDRGGVLGVDGGAVAARAFELGEYRLRLLPFGLEGANPLADEDRVDSGLDRGELTLDPAFDLAKLVGDPLPFVTFAAPQLVGEGRAVGSEVGEPLGPKILVAKKLSTTGTRLSSRTYCHLPWPTASAARSPYEVR